jgi:hypothetical protein
MAEPSIVLELQQLALSKTGDPTELLRKALLVATKLKLEQFREWLVNELNGYPDDNVPDYRKLRCELRAKNPYQGLIPVVFEDDEFSDLLRNVELRSPVSSLHELLLSNSGDGVLTIPLSPYAENLLYKMQEPIGRLPMIRIVGRGQIARVLDSVYNTVLEWSLKLEGEGIMGHGLTFTDAEKAKASKTEITIANFQGVLGNVSHSTLTQNLTMQVTKSDWASLQAALEAAGVTPAETQELSAAIKKDPSPSSKEALGPRVTAWLGKVMLRLAAAGGVVATGAGGDLVAQALWKYYGLG